MAFIIEIKPIPKNVYLLSVEKRAGAKLKHQKIYWDELLYLLNGKVDIPAIIRGTYNIFKLVRMTPSNE